MESPDVDFKIPRQSDDPDDRRNYNAGAIIGIMTGFLRVGWGQIANFRKSIRVGSGTHTATDGTDGAIIADGTAGALIAYDVTGTNNYVRLNRNATSFFITTTEGANLTFAVGTGIMTQAALTTLTAGTSITLGASGFTTQGSRLVAGSGQVYAQINLTAAGAIALGAVIATLASGHRPPASIAIGATKVSGGVYTPITLLINSAGQVVLQTATLALNDLVLCTANFMTV